MGARSRRGVFGAALLLAVAAAPAPAEVPAERLGQVVTLPAPLPHWLWVTDILLERAALVDPTEDGRLLGTVSTGYWSLGAVYSRQRAEIYVPETYYSRRVRGDRTDVLSIFDLRSLAPVAEVVLPPKRALNALPSGNVALSDDGRFVAVFNMTPATSLSIVDVERRRFVGEISTPGCSLVYAAGERRFALLCMDGALMLVGLDDQGRQAEKLRSAPFFDPTTDPVTEKAVRQGSRWVFVSFEGKVHSIDFAGPEVRFEEVWSLTGEDAGSRRWRIGGTQHLALHRATGRLYCLMHEGGPDTHKEAGSEVWVYDLESHERLQRIRLRSPGLTVMGRNLEFGRSWIWPFHHLYGGLLRLLPGPGVQSIQVTQDHRPILATGSPLVGSLAIYDALTGDFQRRVLSGNLTTHGLWAPFGAADERKAP